MAKCKYRDVVPYLELAVSADVARAIAFDLDILLLLARRDFELAFIGIRDTIAAAYASIQRWTTGRTHAFGFVLKERVHTAKMDSAAKINAS